MSIPGKNSVASAMLTPTLLTSQRRGRPGRTRSEEQWTAGRSEQPFIDVTFPGWR